MLVIPAINEVKFPEVLKKIGIAATFSSWVHLDIADGKFTTHKTWNNPEELGESRIKNYELSKLNIEVHLMVENPEAVVKDWVAAGVKRIIVHLEEINIRKSDFLKLRNILEVGLPKIEIGVAINPETPVEKLAPYLDSVKFVQILAVKPGLAGQKFDEKVLEKIKFLKKHYPNVIIEVDGGINLETAKLTKEAGADIIVSASYIFGNPDPRKAYHELAAI